ncbi:SagB family peptide dehydrogenase [Paenibacillus cremeus]|uniref:SagB/ThcOx family dehydrogenase n=1 Tax=Paenibacillus cremeus TaxID=2163881 RepID=A0A559K6N4_9BACL|nr:SagB family peptide dehydrogenase [Paenibacillus cremeus]TVY07753.1 SagB/ThcOx family dehydrogenase [Paenibacillus cremeus]
MSQNLEQFVRHLHHEIDEYRPVDWEVDWADAPLPYKLYRGVPAVKLPSEIPLTLTERAVEDEVDVTAISHFLWYVFGLAQVSQMAYETDTDDASSEESPVAVMQSIRRLVPSGGGLYPSELYMYLKVKGLAEGIYHYDAAHHRLVVLREGNFDAYLEKALGQRCSISECFGAVLVTTVYWKNFFKYHYFGYRLQGLDTGVLMGQLLEVAKRFGFKAGVYFEFLDQAVNHLLGVSEQEESAFAVIPLSIKSVDEWVLKGAEPKERCTCAQLCRELPNVRYEQYIRSRKVIESPMLVRINEASALKDSAAFRWRGLKEADKRRALKGQGVVQLPQVERLAYDLLEASRRRYSPGMDFIARKVTVAQAASLLNEAAASFAYTNDLDGEERVTVYGCFYGVDGIPDGAYRYDASQHGLHPVRPGDQRGWLQSGMSLDNVNLYQVPLCLHVVGPKDHLIGALGYRGYRIQQMEAGMLVQRLILAACALGFGVHPLLGYEVSTIDALYSLEAEGMTALIQLPIGPYRPRPRFEGGLHG